MKGIVFTSFLEMVEQAHGFDMVDTLIEQSDLPSGGHYTAVGTYHHSEIAQLVGNLSQELETPVPELLNQFGQYLFGVLNHSYPEFAASTSCSLDLLEQVENHIHVEVKKIYPEAELPSFACERKSPRQLLMNYQSSRHLDDLCHGLILGAVAHYREQATITRKALSNESVDFLITLI